MQELRRNPPALPGWLVLCLVLVVATEACDAEAPRSTAAAPRAAMIPCTSSLDQSGGANLASGLTVKLTIPADAVGPYYCQAQLYQERRRGPVSYANDRGVDMSRLALPDANAVRIYASRPGPVAVTLWFPGSELRVRASRGEAWVDIQVSDTTWAPPAGATASHPTPQRFFRCHVPRLDPQVFVSVLPGQGIVPPLPKPVK